MLKILISSIVVVFSESWFLETSTSERIQRIMDPLIFSNLPYQYYKTQKSNNNNKGIFNLLPINSAQLLQLNIDEYYLLWQCLQSTLKKNLSLQACTSTELQLQFNKLNDKRLQLIIWQTWKLYLNICIRGIALKINTNLRFLLHNNFLKTLKFYTF